MKWRSISVLYVFPSNTMPRNKSLDPGIMITLGRCFERPDRGFQHLRGSGHLANRISVDQNHYHLMWNTNGLVVDRKVCCDSAVLWWTAPFENIQNNTASIFGLLHSSQCDETLL